MTGSRKDYCGPLTFEPQPNRLFHNRGDGTFDDVTLESQIARQYNGALGVIAVDFNEDGWLDMQVANDARPDELWINQQDGTFKNEALLAGSALDQHGRARASMGVDAGYFDNDGDEDMIITCLRWEGNTFYENTGAGWFEDRSVPTGLGLPSFEFTGFGTATPTSCWLSASPIFNLSGTPSPPATNGIRPFTCNKPANPGVAPTNRIFASPPRNVSSTGRTGDG